MTSASALLLFLFIVAPLVVLKWEVHRLAMSGRLEDLRKLRKSRGAVFALFSMLAMIAFAVSGSTAAAVIFGIFAVFYLLEACNPDLIFSSERFIEMYGGQNQLGIESDDQNGEDTE